MFRDKKRYKYIIIFFLLIFFSCSQLNNIFKFLQKFKIEKKKEDKKDNKNKEKSKKESKKDVKKKESVKKSIKNSNPKESKKEKIIVYVDKEYYNSFYGKLSEKIVIKFLKSNKKEFQVRKIDHNFDINKEKLSFILITNKKNYNLNKSRDLFSEALYFLISREHEKEFKYPDSLKTMIVGIHYNSYVYNYLNEKNPITGKKNYEITPNFKIYADFYNMIEDFRINRLDIVMINRTEYYTLLKTLPSAFLFYIDIGKTFGNLYFKDKNLLKEFNEFCYKNKIKYDWIKFL